MMPSCQNLKTDDVQRALEIYWRFAYPLGSRVCPRMVREWTSVFDCCDGHFVLRAGNRYYPHMKFIIERGLTGDWHFMVDCHDDAEVPVDAQGADRWHRLRRVNRLLKQEIETAWRRCGLPTWRCDARRATTEMVALPDAIRTAVVVDDESDRAMLTARMLETVGYRVRSFTCGRRAIRRVTTRAPDLLVTDLQMPAPDGLVVTREVKAVTQTPVLVTTYAQVSLGDLRPADALLPRPFSRNDLRDAVTKLVNAA